MCHLKGVGGTHRPTDIVWKKKSWHGINCDHLGGEVWKLDWGKPGGESFSTQYYQSLKIRKKQPLLKPNANHFIWKAFDTYQVIQMHYTPELIDRSTADQLETFPINNQLSWDSDDPLNSIIFQPTRANFSHWFPNRTQSMSFGLHRGCRKEEIIN